MVVANRKPTMQEVVARAIARAKALNTTTEDYTEICFAVEDRELPRDIRVEKMLNQWREFE